MALEPERAVNQSNNPGGTDVSSPIIAPPLAGNVLASIGEGFVIAESSDEGAPKGPPRPISPLHLHRNDDEAWYVLQGVLQVQVGDDIVEARAGSAVLVPRGTPHTYWNPTQELVRYLLVMTPRIFRLIQEIHTLRDRNPSNLQALFRKYDSQLLSS